MIIEVLTDRHAETYRNEELVSNAEIQPLFLGLLENTLTADQLDEFFLDCLLFDSTQITVETAQPIAVDQVITQLKLLAEQELVKYPDNQDLSFRLKSLIGLCIQLKAARRVSKKIIKKTIDDSQTGLKVVLENLGKEFERLKGQIKASLQRVVVFDREGAELALDYAVPIFNQQLTTAEVYLAAAQQVIFDTNFTALYDTYVLFFGSPAKRNYSSDII